MRGRGELVLTPAAHAYVVAFEHWLLTSWAPGTEGRLYDGALDLKNACLEELLAEAPS